MLLRRVIEHVKTQNWMAVVLDFLIVVIGVFIGIQVSNWNAARLEVAQGDAYRARIVEDLRYDISRFDTRQVYFAEVMEYAEYAVQHFENPEAFDENSAWRFLLSAYQASQAWPLTIRGSTYEEMRNAGVLGLAGDAALLKSLSEYYHNGAFQIDVLDQHADYREILRGRIPWRLLKYMREYCVDVPDTDTEILLSCDAPQGLEIIDMANELALERDIAIALRARMSEILVFLDVVQDVEVEATQLIERLEAS